jgi:hypothetical protein
MTRPRSACDQVVHQLISTADYASNATGIQI